MPFYFTETYNTFAAALVENLEGHVSGLACFENNSFCLRSTKNPYLMPEFYLYALMEVF